jgi:hypothetical protein
MAKRPRKSRKKAVVHRRLDAWFTLGQMAAAFDVTRQAFHDAVRPLIKADDITGAGERGTLVRCRGAIDAYTDRKVKQALTEVAQREGGNDPLLVGGTSPALEDYRKARAKLANLDVAEREHQLINLGELDSGIRALGDRIRRATELLVRRFGNEVADVMNDAIDEWLADWKREHDQLARAEAT